MAQSVALAVLENLVHMSEQDFPLRYVIVEAILPEDLAITTEADLNRQFGRHAPTVLGDRWLEANQSAVLKVRSAVVAAEYNYLLNPAHPAFKHISVKRARPFKFDTRLLR
jgi:RES domain-containing protein